MPYIHTIYKVVEYEKLSTVDYAFSTIFVHELVVNTFTHKAYTDKKKFNYGSHSVHNKKPLGTQMKSK